MGCFSFLCKECGKQIVSDSSSGQEVKLFLLNCGEVVQEMHGEYDSYGRVFDADAEISESLEWDMDWTDVCYLMFDEDESNGIAVHSECFHGSVPSTRSEDDPNQGWLIE